MFRIADADIAEALIWQIWQDYVPRSKRLKLTDGRTVRIYHPGIMNTDVVDEIIRIGNETAFATARKAASIEGLAVGISSGAALAAALEIGARDGMAGKMIVAILPSFAERYLSTSLFEES